MLADASRAPNVAIEFEGVGLTFTSQSDAPTVALKDVHCRIDPGKVTALIGPSGCGKSTLLQIARGFLDPTRGRLRFVEIASGQVTDRKSTRLNSSHPSKSRMPSSA